MGVAWGNRHEFGSQYQTQCHTILLPAPYSFYQSAIAMADPVTTPKLSSEANPLQSQSWRDQKLAALEEVLTPEQLAKYRQQQEIQNRFRDAWSLLFNMDSEKKPNPKRPTSSCISGE
jgi:hypothetical protein